MNVLVSFVLLASVFSVVTPAVLKNTGNVQLDDDYAQCVGEDCVCVEDDGVDEDVPSDEVIVNDDKEGFDPNTSPGASLSGDACPDPDTTRVGNICVMNDK